MQSHRNPNDIHHRDRKLCHKFHLETQETTNTQDNTQQKELEVSKYLTSNYITKQ
jgi:hypothetical protein